ncbi:hypothetical protein HDZ31DRAFT_68613 [Schizophyllum fasciatum]
MIDAVHVPQISISFAPDEAPVPEPYSPFPWAAPAEDMDDGYRPSLLSPPPKGLTLPRKHSPLRPVEGTEAGGRGIEADRFAALLRSSRERNAKREKTVDLRKEIAVKAHHKKQLERRALFLSKINAPPSPTATATPKTPPESPAIFHYTLPSPGLISPLALFDALNHESNQESGFLSYPREPWVEQVDFRSKCTTTLDEQPKTPKPAKRSRLPSLDDITRRMGMPRSAKADATPSRLPAFLQPARPNLRRNVSAPAPAAAAPVPEIRVIAPTAQAAPPVPSIMVTSPTQPIEQRERASIDMLSTLRRRSPSAGESELRKPAPAQPRIEMDLGSTAREPRLEMLKGLRGQAPRDAPASPNRQQRWKRHSAPAELVVRPRAGFAHPVLSMPGGF